MDVKAIDWKKLAIRNYTAWRDISNQKTLEVLTRSSMLDLSTLNDIGCFHKEKEENILTTMKEDYEQYGTIPTEWFYQRYWPGIWAALFDPVNCSSQAYEGTKVIRMYFNKGFYIYDKLSTEHKNKWEKWGAKGSKNQWSSLINPQGISLERRLKNHDLPHHKKFFEEYKFGAAIGYSDYISVVVLLPKAVQRIQFLNTGDSA